jgi:hypothetical protein
MGKIAQRIEPGIWTDGGRNDVVTDAGRDQRIAVRLGSRGCGRADEAAGPGAVLDVEPLAKRLAEMIGQKPGKGVGGAAR